MPNLTLANLQDMPAVRQLLILAGLAAAIAVGLWLFTWSQAPNYAPLYSGLDDKDSSDVADALRSSAIPFKIDPATGAVTVPADQIHAARLRLASQGLPGGSRAGMEMIEGEQGFGVSQFVETARYQSALETELARTISTLRPVKSARVHLAMPKVSAFTRQRDPASASVVLELNAGRTLEENQVAAIVHMVASSIPDMSSERVTVIDQSGRLLSNQDATSEEAISARQFQQVRRLENTMVQRIQDLLQPLTGPGRVSAQVAVDMDFTASEEAREVYGAEPQKVRSEQISETGAGAATPAPQGVPGAVPNTPPGPAPANNAANNTGTLASRSSTRNYELDRTVSHTVQPGGKVRRVTVAVLVDNVPTVAAPPPADAAAADANAAAVTAATTRALTPEELTRIEALIKEAVGFSADRGDSVSVMNAPFVRPEGETALPDIPLWQQPWVRDVLRLVLGALAVLALIFAVLRPAMRQLVTPVETVAIHQETNPMLTGSPQDFQAPNPNTPALPAALRPSNYEEKLLTARATATQDPRMVAQLVKGWVGADG